MLAHLQNILKKDQHSKWHSSISILNQDDVEEDPSTQSARSLGRTKPIM